MCAVADTSPVLTSSGQLAWSRQHRTLPGVSQSHSKGDTLRAPCPVLQETQGAKSRVVQNYSSKAAVEEIDFQHSGLAILN